MKSYPSRLAGALAALAAAASLPVLAQSPAPAPAKLGSTFYSWDALPFTPNGSGGRRNVVDAPTITFNRLAMHITSLNPGASAHPHPQGHPQEETLLVKQGTIEIMLNGTKHRAGPGAVIFLAPRVLHNITDVGPDVAVYYVMDIYTDLSAAVPDQPADFWAPAEKLHSTVFDCESLPRKATKTGYRIPVVAAPTVTLEQFESHLTTLDVGKNSDVLTDPADEIIIVKSGLVEVSIKGVSCRLAAGSFYFQAANDVHQVKNIGSGPATYQVFKWVSDRTPKPAA